MEKKVLMPGSMLDSSVHIIVMQRVPHKSLGNNEKMDTGLPLPSYSTSPSLAQSVLDHLGATIEKDKSGKIWKFVSKDYKCVEILAADTVSKEHAICLAALKSVTETEDSGVHIFDRT